MMFSRYELEKTSRSLAAEQQKLEQSIDTAQEKKEALNNQETYMQTDEYVEEVAREKLGMVTGDEILFKARDKQ